MKKFRCSVCHKRFAAGWQLAQHARTSQHYSEKRRNGVQRHARPAAKAAHDPLEEHAAYALGRAEGWLQAYADSLGVPGSALAYRVGELLQRNARRKVLGA